METEKLKLRVPETQMNVKAKRHPIGFTAKPRASDIGELVMKLKQRGRRRQRQESNRFRLANNNFACVARFLVHFYAIDARLQRETS